MQALEHLMGDLTPLAGRVRLEPATLLVICQNGKPERVVRPGRSYWRGFGMPLIGGLDGIVVSTATHMTDVTIANVQLQGPFALPSLAVQFGIQLCDRNDYDGLVKYIDLHGLKAAEQLRPQVHSALDAMVRELLGSCTHDELYRSNLRERLSTATVLLDGLFRVESVAYCVPTWNPDAERIAQVDAHVAAERREIEGQALIDQAKWEAELTTLPNRHALELAQLESLIAIAERKSEATGLTVVEIMEPVLASQKADRVYELLKTLMENPRSAGSPHVRALMEMAYGLVAPPGAPASIAGRIPHQIDLTSAADSALSTPVLRLNPEIADAFAGTDVEDHLVGSGLAMREGKAVALLVVDDSGDLPAKAALTRVLSKSVGMPTDCWIVQYSPDLSALVRTYLAQRVRQLAVPTTSWRVTVDDDRLIIGLGLPTGRGTSVRRSLTQPERLIIEPLEQALPYDTVDIVTDDPVSAA